MTVAVKPTKPTHTVKKAVQSDAERQMVRDRDKEDKRARVVGSLLAIAPFIAVVGLWWAIHTIFDPAPTKLVAPTAVVEAFFELVGNGTLSAYISQSLFRLLIGGAIAIGVGVPLGWLLGLDKDVAASAEPVLRFFNAISGIAWLPLAIAWFGFTDRTISAVIIYTMVFPVIFNTMIGVRTVPTVLRDANLSLGSSWFGVIKDVYIPGSFPSVMTGLRLGIGFGWRALIAGEFIVGGGGLGFLIFNSRTAGLTERVMLGMIVLGAVWLLIDRLILRPIEEFTATRWGMVRL